MAVKNTIHLYLVITGAELDPNSITATTGLHPSKTWKRGEHIEGTLRTYGDDGWRLSSQTPPEYELDDQLGGFLNLVEANAALVAIIASHGAELSIVVRAYEYMPALSFSCHHLQ